MKDTKNHGKVVTHKATGSVGTVIFEYNLKDGSTEPNFVNVQLKNRTTVWPINKVIIED